MSTSAWISPTNLLRGTVPVWSGTGVVELLPAANVCDDQPGKISRIQFTTSATATLTCILPAAQPVGVLTLVNSRIGGHPYGFATYNGATPILSGTQTASADLVDGLQNYRNEIYVPGTVAIDKIELSIAGTTGQIVDIGELWIGRRISFQHGFSLSTSFGLIDETPSQFSSGQQGYAGSRLPVARFIDLDFAGLLESELIGTSAGSADSLYSFFAETGKGAPILCAPTFADQFAMDRLTVFGLVQSDLRPSIKGKNAAAGKVFDLTLSVRETR